LQSFCKDTWEGYAVALRKFRPAASQMRHRSVNATV